MIETSTLQILLGSAAVSLLTYGTIHYGFPKLKTAFSKLKPRKKSDEELRQREIDRCLKQGIPVPLYPDVKEKIDAFIELNTIFLSSVKSVKFLLKAHNLGQALGKDLDYTTVQLGYVPTPFSFLGKIVRIERIKSQFYYRFNSTNGRFKDEKQIILEVVETIKAAIYDHFKFSGELPHSVGSGITNDPITRVNVFTDNSLDKMTTIDEIIERKLVGSRYDYPTIELFDVLKDGSVYQEFFNDFTKVNFTQTSLTKERSPELQVNMLIQNRTTGQQIDHVVKLKGYKEITEKYGDLQSTLLGQTITLEYKHDSFGDGKSRVISVGNNGIYKLVSFSFTKIEWAKFEMIELSVGTLAPNIAKFEATSGISGVSLK